VPQQGTLDIQTEFGFLYVPPGQIVVIPRGICFSVALTEPSRGYVSFLFRFPPFPPVSLSSSFMPVDHFGIKWLSFIIYDYF
jgi:hypothetical protein